jgi:hypothetical protein
VSCCPADFQLLWPRVSQAVSGPATGSPSGKYVLTVPIEKAADNLHYWSVTISDRNGNVLFKDDSEFAGHLNVYWAWDKEDRVWLQNSDNGYTYYWKLDNENHWRRYQCDHGTPESLPCSLSPIKR